jgi:hypothetical protein
MGNSASGINFRPRKVLTPEAGAPRRRSVPDLGKYFVDGEPARSSNKAQAYRTPPAVALWEVNVRLIEVLSQFNEGPPIVLAA